MEENNQYKPEVEKIIEATFDILSKTSTEGKTKGEIEGKQICIRYPLTRVKKEIRVSEQEAKQIFIHLLWAYGKEFSVETPTENIYRFSDKDGKEDPKLADGREIKGRAAQVDVSVYDDDKKLAHHIEFKAGNPSEGIRKDIFKLIYEKSEKGNFFVQVLESVDKGTLPNILGKYIDGLDGKEETCKCNITFYIMNHAFSREHKGYWRITADDIMKMEKDSINNKTTEDFKVYFNPIP